MNANFPLHYPVSNPSDFASATPDKSGLGTGFCFGEIMEITDKKVYMKKYLKRWRLVNRYGISLEEYNRLLKNQHGKCAICGNIPNKKGNAGQSLHVDHDHNTGNIRGLLCSSCNLAVGWIEINPELVNNMLDYLKREPEIIIWKMESLL
jgi:hypothetical protein